MSCSTSTHPPTRSNTAPKPYWSHCKLLKAGDLRAEGMFDGGDRAVIKKIEIVDMADLCAFNLMAVRCLAYQEKALLTLESGENLQCEARPGLNGAKIWEFLCPRCSRRCRVLLLPRLGEQRWACAKCHRIVYPSKERQRWRIMVDRLVKRPLPRLDKPRRSRRCPTL